MNDALTLLSSAHGGGSIPVTLTLPLQALWYAKAGNWEQAHDLCQEIPDPDGAWIHAYLHREEGDQGNAAYWYHRAKRPQPHRDLTLQEEWLQIAEYFFGKMDRSGKKIQIP